MGHLLRRLNLNVILLGCACYLNPKTSQIIYPQMVSLSPATSTLMEVAKLTCQAPKVQTKLSTMINGRNLALSAKEAMVESTGLLILPLDTFSL